MSKIDEMIERLCPDGVEYKALGEIGTLTRGKRFVHKDAVEEGIPCIHYGEVYTHFGVWATQAKSHVREDLAPKLRYAKKGDVVIVGAGEAVEDIGIAVAWLGNGNVAVHDACYVLSHDMNPKYISYFCRTAAYHDQIRRFVSTGKISSISVKGVAQARIPVPPMEIQEEIVRILDSFAELEAELEAELAARRAQYAYYRDQLLSFPKSNTHTHLNVRWMTLSDVAEYARERMTSDCIETGCYVGVNELLPDFQGRDAVSREPNEETCIAYRRNDILLGNIRPYLKKMWVADCEGGTNGDVLVIRILDEMTVTSRYLAHVIMSSDFVSYNVSNSKGAKMPRGDKSAIMKYLVPVPPLEEQQRIVDILDKFDTLVNSISAGLPAEIEARRKQYEYYRDKLLTFKEKVA